MSEFTQLKKLNWSFIFGSNFRGHFSVYEDGMSFWTVLADNTQMFSYNTLE